MPDTQKHPTSVERPASFSVYRDILHVEGQGHIRDVPWVVNRIKNGVNAELIEKIRKLTTKSQRDELKKGLLSICWSGTFKRRADNQLIAHSGLCGIDFDNVKDIEAEKAKLKKDPFIHVLFTSPSGDGLKAVVRIPPDPKRHKGAFQALIEHFMMQEFDLKCGNLSRVCYESWDPDIYHNPDSEIFTTIVEDQEFDNEIDPPIIRLYSEDAIITNLLKWHDRKFPLVNGQRNLNLYILSRAFNRYGVSKITADQFLQGYSQEGFGVDEIKRAVHSAYKNVDEFGKKSFEDRTTVDYIRTRTVMGDTPVQISEDVKARIPDDRQRTEAITRIMGQVDGSQFWSKNDKGTVRIHDHKFQAFLHDNGYRKLYPEGSTAFIFVKVVRNLVENTSDKLIKDFTLRYIKNVGDMDVYDKLAGNTKLFKDDYLSMLEPVTIAFVEDTKVYGNLFYKNCCVRAYSNKVEMIDYADLGAYIWSDQIIKRDYVEGVDPEGEFNKFVRLVAGDDGSDKFEGRVLAHCTTLGYLLHSFKNLNNNRAVIYNDSTIDDNPNGGSGKGIMMQALRSVKRMAELDGKTFSFDKGFPYQTVGADTQILVFDDVQRYFYFERLFSIITEGITLEKKNKDAVKIPVQRSPKIVVTTNYTIQGDGGSHERRRWEVEMSSHFGAHHTPYDEFGHQLFGEWTDEEWERFDSFIVQCLQLYLGHGLVQAEWKNLHNRKLAGKTDFDFYEWAGDGDKLPINTRIYKGSKMEEFTNAYQDYAPKGKKALTDKRWKKWLDAYALNKGYESDHSQDHIGRYVIFSIPSAEVVVVKEPEQTIAPF